MKYILLFVCSIFFFVKGFAQDKDISELKKLNEDWINSYPAKDSLTLNRIFADDFTLISPNGKKFTKKDVISNLSSDIRTVHIDSVDVRVITNDVSIITAYISFTTIADGKEMTGKNCYQDVYIKRNRRWYALSAHVTLLSIK